MCITWCLLLLLLLLLLFLPSFSILLSYLYLKLKIYFLPPVPFPMLLRDGEQVAVWCSAACWVKQCHRAVRIYLVSQQRSWDSPSGSSGWGGSPAAPLWWEQPPGLVPSSGTSCQRVPWSPLGRIGGATVKSCCLYRAVPASISLNGSCWHWLVIALLALICAYGL